MLTYPIIEKLGGRQAVAGLVRRRSGGVTVDTVRMWIARDSIPGYALRQMIAAAEGRGIRVDASDLRRYSKKDVA